MPLKFTLAGKICDFENYRLQPINIENLKRGFFSNNLQFTTFTIKGYEDNEIK